MSKLMEVKANLSFGAYRVGRVYEVDLDDVTVLSLLGVGYLTPVNDDEGGVDAGGGMDSVPRELGAEDSVPGPPVLRGVRVVGSPEPGGVNVDDPVESGGSAPKRKASSLRGSKASDGEGASGGEDARSEGHA